MILKNTLFWKFDTVPLFIGVVPVVPVGPPLVGVVPVVPVGPLLVGVVPVVETVVPVVPPFIRVVPVIETVVLPHVIETLVGVSYFIHIHGRVYIIPVIRQLSFPSGGTCGR